MMNQDPRTYMEKAHESAARAFCGACEAGVEHECKNRTQR